MRAKSCLIGFGVLATLSAIAAVAIVIGLAYAFLRWWTAPITGDRLAGTFACATERGVATIRLAYPDVLTYADVPADAGLPGSSGSGRWHLSGRHLVLEVGNTSSEAEVDDADEIFFWRGDPDSNDRIRFHRVPRSTPKL